MALILNIETATTVCSVGLAKNGKLLSLKEINNGYTHSENLTIFIQEVFKGSLYTVSDVDAIAVSKGPGSYTGLRIGVSTAKGLCAALDKPLIAINTLQSMAWQVSKDFNYEAKTLFCPMLDARRMEVYCAILDSEGKELKSTTAKIIDEQSFSDLLVKNKIVFFGDGSEKCKKMLQHQTNAVFIENCWPSAKGMIDISEELFNKKQFEDVAYFEPFYLKDFVTTKPR